MSIVARDSAQDLKSPLIALILGVLPFFVFVGSSSTTTINGQVVQASSFNIAGLALAIAGLVVAVRALARGGAFLRLGVCVVAALLCAMQIGISADLYTFADIRGLVG